MKKTVKNQSFKFKKLAEYIDHLLEAGEICFTKKEALLAMDVSEIALLNSALRLVKKRILVKPFDGFYIIVTPEHKKAGSPPPVLFLDKLMRHLKLPYYLGLLSAAKYFGATHQAAMETQVMTTKAIPLKKIGKHRIKFLVNKYTSNLPVQDLKTPQGPIKISTPEATAFDLVRYHQKAAGFSHVVTVLKEMSEAVDGRKLPRIAEIYKDVPLVQRVGYLIDVHADQISTSHLHQWLKNKSCNPIKLSGKRAGQEIERNAKWYIIRDIEVEADDI